MTKIKLICWKIHYFIECQARGASARELKTIDLQTLDGNAPE